MKLSNNGIPVVGTVANQNAEFQITDTKLYVPVVTLPTQENIKLLKQLESGFERLINIQLNDKPSTRQIFRLSN